MGQFHFYGEVLSGLKRTHYPCVQTVPETRKGWNIYQLIL